MATDNTGAAAASEKPAKKKRVVKKRPLLIAYTGDNLVVKAATRDAGTVLDLVSSDPTIKVAKVEG